MADRKFRETMQPVKGARISRGELFMGVVELLAQRSTCLRGKLGAVIVKDNRIVATGYNGAPPHMPHCLDEGCIEKSSVDLELYLAGRPQSEWERSLGCKRSIHAEANALAFAARHGVATGGATMYGSQTPCLACAQLLVSAGIEKYVAGKMYRDPAGYYLLDHACIPVVDIDGKAWGLVE